MGLAMQERMRAGFLDLARSAPARIRVIDGNRDADSIAAEVAALARAALR
jgi:dTMP kinase